jgi:hypothetical protein
MTRYALVALLCGGDMLLLSVLVGLYFRTRRELEDLRVLLVELYRLKR